MKPLALASDDAGATLRAVLAGHLDEQGVPFIDYGFDDPDQIYPAIAHDIAVAVIDGRHERAILVCGTGIGMCIAANKVPGVYAALCHDTYSAERARKSNGAQVLTMGARVVGPELAKAIVDIWLGSEFDAARSGSKIAALRALEERHT